MSELVFSGVHGMHVLRPLLPVAFPVAEPPVEEIAPEELQNKRRGADEHEIDDRQQDAGVHPADGVGEFHPRCLGQPPYGAHGVHGMRASMFFACTFCGSMSTASRRLALARAMSPARP